MVWQCEVHVNVQKLHVQKLQEVELHQWEWVPVPLHVQELHQWTVPLQVQELHQWTVPLQVQELHHYDAHQEEDAYI